MIDPATTVAELVVERPARARVFERLGIDYCCGGKTSLAEACESRGLDVKTAVAFLDAGTDASGETEDWATAPLDELVRHIVDEHHAKLRTELPRISGLLEKCVRAHGQELPSLAELRAAFEQLRGTLELHMDEEEQVLFPALADADPDEVGRLEHDHDAVGSSLLRLRELGGDYDSGTALCNTHRATLSALAELELDLHQHIHEENNILFPRALAAAA
jgi:regulator of cell morphogenesis and NO signaling